MPVEWIVPSSRSSRSVSWFASRMHGFSGLSSWVWRSALFSRDKRPHGTRLSATSRPTRTDPPESRVDRLTLLLEPTDQYMLSSVEGREYPIGGNGVYPSLHHPQDVVVWLRKGGPSNHDDRPTSYLSSQSARSRAKAGLSSSSEPKWTTLAWARSNKAIEKPESSCRERYEMPSGASGCVWKAADHFQVFG